MNVLFRPIAAIAFVVMTSACLAQERTTIRSLPKGNVPNLPPVQQGAPSEADFVSGRLDPSKFFAHTALKRRDKRPDVSAGKSSNDR